MRTRIKYFANFCIGPYRVNKICSYEYAKKFGAYPVVIALTRAIAFKFKVMFFLRHGFINNLIFGKADVVCDLLLLWRSLIVEMVRNTRYKEKNLNE